MGGGIAVVAGLVWIGVGTTGNTARPAADAGRAATVMVAAEASVFEEPAPSGTEEAVAVPASPSRRGAHPGRGRAAKPDCDPPWTLDGGIKHYKDECL